MPERDGKDQGEDKLHVARTCILRADVVLSFSGVVTFVLFCFVFVFFFLSLKPRPFAQAFFVLRYTINTILLSACFFVFVSSLFLFLWKWRFFRVFLYHCRFSHCMESTSYVFSFRIVFFYLVTTGWIFDISLCENSINQSIN